MPSVPPVPRPGGFVRDDRYGSAPRRSSRVAVRLLAGLGIAVFLGVVGWMGLRFADMPAHAETVAYQHVDEATVAVEFQVTMSPGTVAECDLVALNDTRAQVGFVTATVGPSEEPTTRHRAEIRTQEPAVSAIVDRCVPVQD